jgi:hypothetical protein
MARSLSIPRQRVNEKDKIIDKCYEWDVALRDTHGLLLQANLRRNQIREAMEIIKKKIKAGEPWPGTATHI